MPPLNLEVFPTAPKPEWFMQHANNVHTVSPHLSVSTSDHSTSSQANNGSVDFSQYQQVATEFQKFTASGWSDYLSAFQAWRRTVATIKADNHSLAVERRSLKKLKEHVLGWVQPGTSSPIAAIPPNRIGPSTLGPTADVVIVTEPKIPVPPVLSTKPHAKEKRANKRMLADEKRKSAAERLNAARELEPSKRKTEIKVAAAVSAIKTQLPLFRAETLAAKSAAERAKLIRNGSTDLVVNVAPDDGWKLVTRKKGDIMKSGMVHHQTVGDDKYVTTYIDPAAQSSRSVLSAAARQPNTVVAK
jgi:hypothetical protein